MWLSVVCTLIDNDTRHHSGQEVVDSRGADVRANIFQSIDIFLILLQSDNGLLVCVIQRKKKEKKFISDKKRVENYPDFDKLAHVFQRGLQWFIV